MSRVCYFTGKKTSAGRSIARRGKAKYLGGVGKKVTGITRRKFKPNIQRVRAVVDGRVCRIKVSAKAIKMGLVVKPVKRNWQPPAPVPTQRGKRGPESVPGDDNESRDE
ncbi:MAG: 50S ribosomal protein L28 [Phycisphaerae bacterium]